MCVRQHNFCIADGFTTRAKLIKFIQNKYPAHQTECLKPSNQIEATLFKISEEYVV